MHNEILNAIFHYPEELGKNTPPTETIILKLKEPYFPNFSNFPINKYKGSIVDLIFLYCHEVNEIIAVELKTGFFCHTDHGIYQIHRTKDYFINHWKKWICSSGRNNNICPSLDFYFSGILLVEKHLEPIENWVKTRCRTKLGKL